MHLGLTHCFFCGLGFILVNDDRCIILANAISPLAESSLHAKILALRVALDHYCEWQPNPIQVLCDCTLVLEILDGDNPCMAWRFQDEVNNVNQFTRINADLVIDYNPKDFNGVADALAWLKEVTLNWPYSTMVLICLDG